jgi:hypothetical protein
MTDKEKEDRRILKRVGKTIHDTDLLLRSLGAPVNDPKSILSSKSKSKWKKLK